MQITIDQITLSKNLSIITRAVSAKTILPILQTVLIELDRSNSKIICTATNLEMYIRATIPAQFGLIDDCPDLKQICIDGNQFKNIINSLPASKPVEITMEFNNGIDLTVDNLSGINISSSKAKFWIPVVPSQEFPAMQEPSGKVFTLSSDKFIQAVKQTIFATLPDDPRPFLFALCWDFEPGKMKIVATDVNRLAIYELSLDTSLSQRILVPVNSLKKVLDAFKNEENIEFQVTEKEIFMISGNIVVRLSLVNSSFPNYQQVLNNFGEIYGEITIDTESFSKILSRAKLVHDDVVLKMAPGSSCINVSASGDRGKFQEDFSIEEINANNELFNMFAVKFLLEVLKISETESFKCQYFSQNKPAQFIEKDDTGKEFYQYIVMPVKMAA